MFNSKKDIPNFQVEKYFEGKISMREFLVDFFGALMPGVFFLIFLVPTFIIPMNVLLQTLSLITKKDIKSFKVFISPDDLSFIEKIPTTFDLAIVLLFFAFGYIVGTLFYRIDPKIPDFRSFLKIVKGFSNGTEVVNWVARVRDEKFKYIDDPKDKRWRQASKDDVQYPYNNLRVYLVERGWTEIANKIPWTPVVKQGEVDKRSKTFINSLKIRLQFFFPDQCSTIIKNEAHIRLSSSMWFASHYLRKFSLFGIITIGLSGGIINLISIEIFNGKSFEMLVAFSLCTIVLALSFYVKYSIEKFLHYQRVREIMYVLQTAIIASKSINDGEDKIWGANIIKSS